MKIFISQLVEKTNIPQVTADEATLQKILTIIFVIIGALAFLMLVVAGFRYILSQGQPDKVAEIKRQILYALVGLIVAVLAGAIVNLVLGRLD